MGTQAAIWPILLGVLVVSVGVAVWPLRPAALRAGVMAAHVAASTILISTLDGPWQMWFVLLMWGGIIALVRLSIDIVRGVTRLAHAGNSLD
ncbi:hypothetical protein ACWEOE_19460 [Amycolatopsis sp. NPDC004368]